MDGSERMGSRLHQVLRRLRLSGARSRRISEGGLVWRIHRSLGLPERGATRSSTRRRRRLPHQWQYQPQGRPDLPRSRKQLLFPDQDLSVQGREMVLHGRGSRGFGVEGSEAVGADDPRSRSTSPPTQDCDASRCLRIRVPGDAGATGRSQSDGSAHAKLPALTSSFTRERNTRWLLMRCDAACPNAHCKRSLDTKTFVRPDATHSSQTTPLCTCSDPNLSVTCRWPKTTFVTT